MASPARRSSRFGGVPSRSPRLAALCLSAPLLGCASDCPLLELCDIRDTGCQQHTAQVAACLSGEVTLVPPVTVVNADDFIDERVDAVTEETPDDRDRRRGLALLGLMPSQLDPAESERDDWSRVAAFYDPDTESVTVLNRSRKLNDTNSVSTLLHELIHAMQFQRPEVVAFAEQPRSYDAGLAWRSLTEGEAQYYEDLAISQGMGFEVGDVDWDAAYLTFQARSYRQLVASKKPFTDSWSYFPYAFGGYYLQRAWQEGGSASVREQFSQLPPSTRSVLAGYGALPPSPHPSWLDVPDAEGLPLLPSELERVLTLRAGAWLFGVFDAKVNLVVVDSFDAIGAGLLGDVLSVFREPATGDVDVFWRLRFEDPAYAVALAERLESTPAAFRLGHAQIGSDVLIAASTRGRLPNDYVEGLSWGPVEEPPGAADAASASLRWQRLARGCPRSL